MDRVDRRALPLLRQRHPDLRGRHARERPEGGHRQGGPQLHRRRTTLLPEGRRPSRPRTSARASWRSSPSTSSSRSSRGRRRSGSTTPRSRRRSTAPCAPPSRTGCNENPTVAEQIVGRIVLAARAREASRAAAQQVTRKTAISHRLNLPGKLADCSSTDPAESRALHRRGRLGRRLGQAGARPPDAGDPPAPRQGAQRRAGELGEGRWRTRSCTDIVSALGCGIGDDFDISQAPLRQDLPPDGRRRRRPPHLDAAAHLLLPAPARSSSTKGTSTSPSRRSTGSTSGKETYWALDERERDAHPREAPEEREARDHALQGPRRDDARAAQGDDARPAPPARAEGHRPRRPRGRAGRSPTSWARTPGARYRFITERAREADSLDV